MKIKLISERGFTTHLLPLLALSKHTHEHFSLQGRTINSDMRHLCIFTIYNEISCIFNPPYTLHTFLPPTHYSFGKDEGFSQYGCV